MAIRKTKNIFEKITSLGALEDAYLEALKGNKYPEDVIEDDYIERRGQLQNNLTMDVSFETNKKGKRKESKKPSNSMAELDVMHLVYARGNQDMGGFTPILDSGIYEDIPQRDTRIGFATAGAYFRDYIPYIENNTLYLRQVTKGSDLIMIQKDIEIRREDGEQTQLDHAYIVHNRITDREIDGQSVSVVDTFLLDPNTRLMMWQIATMWAYHDGEVEQVTFRPNDKE